mmetsp:Transcript_76485/g.247581  ORF Transcript_76485/g.247581 Transcript_76485/m.247581 type:complete len:479 (+) Transcript_76485:97-1533(+)
MASAALAVDVLAMGADERNIELLGAGRAPAASDGPLAAAVAVCGDSRLEEPFNFHTEACKILGLAVPVALSNLFEYLPVLFLVAAVGHLPHSEEALAATALGRNFFNSWWGIAWGFTSALHTLAPQAEGAGRADLHALHAQRAALILTLLCVPLGLVQVFSGGILRLLGQDPVVSAAAAPFATRLIPRLFAESYFTILQRVGQAMGHASAVAAVTMVGCVGSALFLWIFIDVWHLGYLGVAWACVAWNGLNTVALAMFLFRQRGPGRGRSLFVPYKPFRDVVSCAGLREYLSLAVPSTLQVCIEWWALDLGVMLAAGTLPDPTLNLGANAVVSSVAGMNYMVWVGVQCATSIMVGKHVGSGVPRPHGERSASPSSWACSVPGSWRAGWRSGGTPSRRASRRARRSKRRLPEFCWSSLCKCSPTAPVACWVGRCEAWDARLVEFSSSFAVSSWWVFQSELCCSPGITTPNMDWSACGLQ